MGKAKKLEQRDLNTSCINLINVISLRYFLFFLYISDFLQTNCIQRGTGVTFRTVTSFIFLFVDDHLSHGNICFPGSGISIKVFQVPFVNLFDIRRLYILSCLNFSITAVHHIFLLPKKIAPDKTVFLLFSNFEFCLESLNSFM